ncbi:MAG: hypothetical protein QOE61_5012 [Micromonosporaceae bacterium]|nr:hypothetical protein [Micromonosporaceae bacterium]
MGAKTSTTASDRESRSATGTMPTRLSAQRGSGPMSWTSSVAAADPASTPGSSPEPRLRQLMGVCGWAAVLGGVGLVIGIRGLIGVVAGHPPGWFEPGMIVVGFVGISLTVGAFLTVHRNRTPWALLGASSLALIAAMVLTSQAF